MPKGQDQQQQEQKGQSKPPFPALPKAMEKRVSLKWLTMEALSKVSARYQAEGKPAKLIFLTAWGQIEGRLNEIKPSYAESFFQRGDHLSPDVASMVTHIRAELLALYEQEEQKSGQGSGGDAQSDAKSLELVDTAPILSLTDVVLRSGGESTKLPHLTLFADQVIGFSLASTPVLH